MSEHHCDDCPKPTGGPMDAELMRIHLASQWNPRGGDDEPERPDCACTTDVECCWHFTYTMQHAKKMGTRDFVWNPWGKNDFLELARLLASDKQDTMTLDPKTLREMCAVLVDIIDEQRIGKRALAGG